MRGLPQQGERRPKALEYMLVILTVTIIVILATWFLGHEIASGLGAPLTPPR